MLKKLSQAQKLEWANAQTVALAESREAHAPPRAVISGALTDHGCGSLSRSTDIRGSEGKLWHA